MQPPSYGRTPSLDVGRSLIGDAPKSGLRTALADRAARLLDPVRAAADA